jgi:hypothetical protein
MDLERYSTSEGFFEFSPPLVEPEWSQFDSMRGRAISLCQFFEKLALVPFAFLFKAVKTFFRFVGVGLSAGLLVITLFCSQALRELFVRRVSFLAKDLADWVLWPVAVVGCLGRLLLAAFVHPALYFRF